MANGMSRDSLDLSPYHVGVRKRYSVPLSCLAHAVVVGALVVAPLVATGAMPTPASVLVFATPVSPPAPPVPSAPGTVASRVSPEPPTLRAVPTTAPPEVVAEGVPALGLGAGRDVRGDMPETGGARVDALAAPPPFVPPVQLEPLRVGGQVKEPQKIKHVNPVYPPIAQAAHVSGTVVLDAVIGPDGRVQGVTVRTSVPLLDRAAIDAVRQWVFTPTTLNGIAVPVLMEVTVNFRLR
jgi:protein TonB